LTNQSLTDNLSNFSINCGRNEKSTGQKEFIVL
jgi:hypothetical protein